jgi:hypothetical protein
VAIFSPHFDAAVPRLLSLLSTCRKARLDSLRDEHGLEGEAGDSDSAWVLGSAEFSMGVAELCLFKVLTLQASLATLSGKYMFTKLLQEKVGSARKQHRALDRQLNRHRAKIKEEVQQLLAWVAQLRARLGLLPANASQGDQLARTGIATAAAAAAAAGAAHVSCVVVYAYACCCAHPAGKAYLHLVHATPSMPRRGASAARCRCRLSAASTCHHHHHHLLLLHVVLRFILCLVTAVHSSPFFLACCYDLAAAGDHTMAWAAVSAHSDQRMLAAAASALEQQLCVGEHPWHTASGYPAGRLGAVQQRMGMVALDLRAAGQEQKIVLLEMRTLLASYEAEVAELQQAIAAAAARVSYMMQEQDALSEQLLAAGGPGQQWHERQCRYNSLLKEQRALLGRQVLLRKLCLHVQQLLAGARQRFGRYISSADQQELLTVEQLAEVADDEVRQQEGDGAGGEQEDVNEADAAMWEEAAAAGPAGDEAAGMDAAGAPGVDAPAQQTQQPPASAGLAAANPASGTTAPELWRFWWSEQVGAHSFPLRCHSPLMVALC